MDLAYAYLSVSLSFMLSVLIYIVLSLSHARTRARARTHVRRHAHTHARAHTHTHKHTNTHTPFPNRQSNVPVCTFIIKPHKKIIFHTYCTGFCPKEKRKGLLAPIVLSTYISMRKPSTGGLTHPRCQHEHRTLDIPDMPVS